MLPVEPMDSATHNLGASGAPCSRQCSRRPSVSELSLEIYVEEASVTSNGGEADKHDKLPGNAH